MTPDDMKRLAATTTRIEPPEDDARHALAAAIALELGMDDSTEALVKACDRVLDRLWISGYTVTPHDAARR